MHLFTKKAFWTLSILISIFMLGACSSTADVLTPSAVEATPTNPPKETMKATSPAPTETGALPPTKTEVEGETIRPTVTPREEISKSILADVLSVAVSGNESAYQFAVEIHSPDTGCEQYADWWEVVSEDGKLIYRRILTHSHVSEQPFTRSGGAVGIGADTVVIVRAHMHPGGYGGAAFLGSVTGGFEAIQLEPDFAQSLDEVAPLPDGCGF